MKTLLAIALLCVPAFAQQVNVDIVPASPGLNLGHTNQRFNANLDHVDANSVTVNGSPVGGGLGCGTPGNPGIAYNNGTICVVDTNATLDGNGNQTVVSVTGTTGSFSTLNTTGPGWTKTVQCQSAPANPPSGSITFYCDSGSGLFATRNSAGGSANPGGATWGTITPGTNSNAGNYISTGNSYDYTGTTFLGLRVGAGAVTTKNGDQAYDTTNKNWHIWANGVDNFIAVMPVAGTHTNGNCVQQSLVANVLVLVDSGGACGGSGSASLIPFSCGAAISSTVTDFCGFANLNTSEANSQSPVSRAGTVSNLQCRIGGAGLSSTQTITIMVRKGAAALGSILSADTTLTCTLNSTNTQGCSDGTHSFAVVAGDVLNIRTVPLNTPAIGVVTCSAQF